MAESAVVSSVQWIGSLLIQEAKLLLEVEDQVRNLQQQLRFMQEYLRDADSCPGEEVRALTVAVRKLVYDAEDLIDTYILKVTPKTELTDRNWLIKLARYVYRSPHAYKVGKQIHVLQSDVIQLMDHLSAQGVRRTSHVVDTYSRKKSPSYPHDEGEYIVGWEKDIQKLIQVLMGQGKNQGVRVVTIMGMGGSGKTTLARKLYNHSYVRECFDCCAWVFISQQWSTQHVLFEILRQVGGTGGQKLETNISNAELVDKLRNILEKKSFLVVLDDVWRRKALEEIFHAIPKGNNSKGSKIIITTRNQAIAQFQNPNYSYIYEPRPLDEDQGWELLSKFALNHHTDIINNIDMRSFERVGREMLRQCDGLPLAIVALAGILREKESIGKWQEVRDVVRTRVMEGTATYMSGKVGDMLALSYDDLPHYLKPCFLHLGLFPEDCEIQAGMLTRMWVAEGLVAPRKDMSVEDVATQCLEELSHRFMIQVVKTNYQKEIKAIRLHDLLRDLCITKAREQSFLEVYSPKESTSSGSSLAIEPRRAALHSSIKLPARASHLRSLLLLTRSSVSDSAYRSKEMMDLGIVHNDFKLLRVLNLWGFKTASGFIPEEIGRLIHLRYLGIRASNITELPRSIGNLRNLLTLDYRNIESDNNAPVKIPNVLWKLVLLRHLFLPIECPWNVKELNLSTMKNLQTLWGVKQDGRGHWLSRELSMLSKSLKKLRVVVSMEEDLEATFSCPSLMSDGLQTFHCELRDNVALERVNSISEHQHLYKFTLVGRIQMGLHHLLPANLVMLELNDSMLKNGDPMSALGALAHLKHLKVSNFYMGSSFSCKPGSFPQLEELYLGAIENLVVWKIELGAMMCLKKLEILRCRKLEFPCGLVFVTSLKQLEFLGVPKEFAQRASAYGWSPQKLRLPYNCEAIIEQCDSPVDMSSIRKLYEQLTGGVFLKNKTQKYWVMKQHDCYYNCFMLYALCLSVRLPLDDEQALFPLDDYQLYKSQKIGEDSYVQKSRKMREDGNLRLDCSPWVLSDQLLDLRPTPTVLLGQVSERGYGAPVTLESYDDTALLESYDDTVPLESYDDFALLESYDDIYVIKVQSYHNLQVAVKFNTEHLSPHVAYEVAYVIMIPKSASGKHMRAAVSLLYLPNRHSPRQRRRHELNDRPTGEWVRLCVGEFKTTSENIGEITFLLRQIEPGILIQGVIIEPNSSAF